MTDQENGTLNGKKGCTIGGKTDATPVQMGIYKKGTQSFSSMNKDMKTHYPSTQDASLTENSVIFLHS
jgi:hypothetical protein